MGDNGRLGHGSVEAEHKPRLVDDTAVGNASRLVVAVAVAGKAHSFILTADKRILAAGARFFGRLGVGPTRSHALRFTRVHLPSTPMRGMSAGANHSAFLAEDDRLFTCGWNMYGQLGNGKTLPEEEGEWTPVHILPPTGVQPERVVCGGNFTLVVARSGQLLSVGCNADGELGQGGRATHVTRLQPVGGLGESGIADVAAGPAHACVLTNDGAVFLWGSPADGRLGMLLRRVQATPKRLELPPLWSVRGVRTGDRHTGLLVQTGRGRRAAVLFGWNKYGQLGRAPRRDVRGQLLDDEDAVSDDGEGANAELGNGDGGHDDDDGGGDDDDDVADESSALARVVECLVDVDDLVCGGSHSLVTVAGREARMLQYARAGDADGFLWALGDDAGCLLEPWTACDTRGRNAAALAAAFGHIDVMQHILALSSAIEWLSVADAKGRAPLSAAVRPATPGAGQAAAHIVRAVLDVMQRNAAVAMVNARDGRSRTALHESVLRGLDECTALLLAADGVQVDATDEDGRSPLHLAVRRNDISVAKKLAARGAPLKQRDVHGRSPLAMCTVATGYELKLVVGMTDVLVLHDDASADDRALAERLCKDLHASHLAARAVDGRGGDAAVDDPDAFAVLLLVRPESLASCADAIRAAARAKRDMMCAWTEECPLPESLESILYRKQFVALDAGSGYSTAFATILRGLQALFEEARRAQEASGSDAGLGETGADGAGDEVDGVRPFDAPYVFVAADDGADAKSFAALLASHGAVPTCGLLAVDGDDDLAYVQLDRDNVAFAVARCAALVVFLDQSTATRVESSASQYEFLVSRAVRDLVAMAENRHIPILSVQRAVASHNERSYRPDAALQYSLADCPTFFYVPGAHDANCVLQLHAHIGQLARLAHASARSLAAEAAMAEAEARVAAAVKRRGGDIVTIDSASEDEDEV